MANNFTKSSFRLRTAANEINNNGNNDVNLSKDMVTNLSALLNMFPNMETQQKK